MPSDAEITLAFVAKRQGKDSMGASEWAHVLSLEIGWLSPGAAKSFVSECESTGLLEADGDLVRISFDRKAVEIPKRYKPPTPLEVVASNMAPPVSASADPFVALIERIAKERKMTKGDVLSEVSALQEQFGGRLSAEAAAVRIGLTHDLDVNAEARAGLERLSSKSK